MNVPKERNSRRLLPAIISIAVLVAVVAIWLGVHPSSATSGEKPPVAEQPTKVMATNNQSSNTVTGGPSIHFPEPLYDFGTVSQGDKVSHTFTIQNIGNEPLKIIRAKGS